ncbi:hypothetical protein F5Y15DRAFT_302233 [Xylariaceae sp. FL0016]|nr:hypothetical protein F5Y15DRAFT_302233 [Xylariaceae sp. FL0016]
MRYTILALLLPPASPFPPSLCYTTQITFTLSRPYQLPVGLLGGSSEPIGLPSCTLQSSQIQPPIRATTVKFSKTARTWTSTYPLSSLGSAALLHLRAFLIQDSINWCLASTRARLRLQPDACRSAGSLLSATQPEGVSGRQEKTTARVSCSLVSRLEILLPHTPFESVILSLMISVVSGSRTSLSLSLICCPPLLFAALERAVSFCLLQHKLSASH